MSAASSFFPIYAVQGNGSFDWIAWPNPQHLVLGCTGQRVVLDLQQYLNSNKHVAFEETQEDWAQYHQCTFVPLETLQHRLHDHIKLSGSTKTLDDLQTIMISTGSSRWFAEDASKTTKSSTKSLGVICTKLHEFDAMCKVISRNVDVPPVNRWITEYMRESTFEWQRVLIHVVTFISEQGPITCTLLVPLLLQRLEGLETLIMPGICGGTQLGNVIVATSARGLDLGRRVWSETNDCYEDEHELGKFTVQHEVTPLIQHTVEAANRTYATPSSHEAFEVRLGRMLSVTKVRNDIADVMLGAGVTDAECAATGVEMESYSLFRVAQALKKSVIAIVKGTSDVGREHMDTERNRAQLERVQPQLSSSSSASGVTVEKNEQARKAYRRIAAENAAVVTWDIIQQWLQAN